MSNMIKTKKYNKFSGGRIQIMCLCFATDDGNNNIPQYKRFRPMFKHFRAFFKNSDPFISIKGPF